MGLKNDAQYQIYHRVLNRAKWCGLITSKLLLGLLVSVFVVANVLVNLGVDETPERHKGDPHPTKRSVSGCRAFQQEILGEYFGLRWVSMMLIVPVPWSSRVVPDLERTVCYST